MLQYYTAVGPWWRARESEGQRAMPARHALALPAVAQAHPHDLPTWAPQLPRQSPPTTMERTATVVLFALFDSVPASGNVVGLYMLPLPPICIACYSSTSSVICTVLMAWHWQVLDARRWRMERRRRSARSGSNQTGQACSSTSTHGTEVRNKERKKEKNP